LDAAAAESNGIGQKEWGRISSLIGILEEVMGDGLAEIERGGRFIGV
jgi:hypothetical protein